MTTDESQKREDFNLDLMGWATSCATSWSHHSHRLLTTNIIDNTLRIIDMDTNISQVWGLGAFPNYVKWSPDDRHILVVFRAKTVYHLPTDVERPDKVRIMDSETGSVVHRFEYTWYSHLDDVYENYCFGCNWSPDGRYICVGGGAIYDVSEFVKGW